MNHAKSLKKQLNDLLCATATKSDYFNIVERQVKDAIDAMQAELDNAKAKERERCAQKCELRADSMREGSEVARLCARDIRNGADSDDVVAELKAKLAARDAEIALLTKRIGPAINALATIHKLALKTLSDDEGISRALSEVVKEGE